MSLATVRSCALVGITPLPVTVEVHLGGGLPGMAIVGLPESAVRESKDRVRAAIRHAGFRFPQVKVVVNLAPADLPKRGGRFDLPIALGVLIASGQLPEAATAGLVVVGELGLGGELRAVEGVLPAAQHCRDEDEAMLVPAANLAEATRCRAARVCGAATLGEACAALAAPGAMRFAEPAATEDVVPDSGLTSGMPDLADVVGQHGARRALEIAAAGEHNLLLSGPPGTGKSMLASRLPGILPPLEEAEAGEVAAIASVSRAGFDPDTWGRRPYRAPHHTASGVALVGGGVPPRPGEVSLAHHGVLFLDELTEFRRPVLEVLREPLESAHVVLSRAALQASFPARFQLVAAMNPCPCGYHGDDNGACRCTPDMVLSYRGRLSGPFLERVDLHVGVRREALAPAMLALFSEAMPEAGAGVTADSIAAVPECSARVRERTGAARRRQLARQGCANARLPPGELGRHCRLDAAGRALLVAAAARFELSLRGVHRVLRVARTIADLAEEGATGTAHLAEALGYRERVPVDVATRWNPGADATL